jgi:hypothetical protein
MRDRHLRSGASVVFLPVVMAGLQGAPALGARPAPETLTPAQQIVVAAVINDTFPLPRPSDGPLVLCLDIQLSDLTLDGEPPPEPSPKRGPARGEAKAQGPKPPVIRGAPPELIERVSRPWRTVVSALACQLDPRRPLTLNHEKHTLAQLVTVRMTAHVAAGAVKIDWTSPGSSNTAATSGRDCTATRGPRGWSVRCGGTWTQ